MPFVLRQSQDEDNPRLPDAYGKQITAGRLVYYEFDGSCTRFICFLCRGGEYGCEGLQKFYYNGQEVAQFAGPGQTNPNWVFHPGTVTAQIQPKGFSVSGSTLNFAAAHGYTLNTPVRVRAIDNGAVTGTLPGGLSESAKYYVTNPHTTDLQLSATENGAAITLTSAGTGTLLIWKADAGIDDPVQGAPKILAGINYTFSGICYVEGYVPQPFSHDGEEPTGFKFILDCRKVADYDANGNINLPSPTFSANNARVAADILLQELKLPASRIDWTSWHTFKIACDTPIWSRVNEASSFTTGPGLIGKYYNHPDLGTSNTIPEFTDSGVVLAKTRGGEEINFTWGALGPDTGVQVDWFLVRWEGKLRPAFSELYTFTANADNGIRVWVNGVQIINRWTHTTGQITGTAQLQKNQLVDVKVEYFEGWGAANVSLSWSSQSNPLQIVPRSRLYPPDHQVSRYEAHLAIPGAMTAWQAFEEVMERAPGWHWQDVNGKIKFLAPNRASVHRFDYDPDAPLTSFNIAGKTFEASPRAPEERVNYQRYEFRDVESEVYAQSYIESHRTDLREQQGGAPSDTQLLKIGVMSRSLAERIAETRMKLLTDPERQFTLRGQLDSYKVSKGDRVTLSHLLSGDKYSNPVDCLVTTETTGGNADEKTYTLLPVVFPFYTDEPV